MIKSKWDDDDESALRVLREKDEKKMRKENETKTRETYERWEVHWLFKKQVSTQQVMGTVEEGRYSFFGQVHTWKVVQVELLK